MALEIRYPSCPFETPNELQNLGQTRIFKQIFHLLGHLSM